MTIVSSALVDRLRLGRLTTRLRLSPQQSYLWGLGLGSLVLGLVNGALVISAGVGIVAYRQLEQLSPAQWQALRQRLQGVFPRPRSTPQQALRVGLLLAASTYTLTSLWQNTHSPVLALILTGQTALTVLVVLALLRSPARSSRPNPAQQMASPNPGKGDKAEARADSAKAEPTITLNVTANDHLTQFDHRLADLTDADPLKRLIAVRQLLRLVGQLPTPESDAAVTAMPSHLLDCFHLMLAHESEPIVRSAVREGLNQLRQPPQLPEGPSPLPNICHLTSEETQPGESSRQRRRLAVEYIEYLEI